MKTLALIKVFFFLFLTTGTLQAQNVIYSEDFSEDIGKGFDGNVNSAFNFKAIMKKSRKNEWGLCF